MATILVVELVTETVPEVQAPATSTPPPMLPVVPDKAALSDAPLRVIEGLSVALPMSMLVITFPARVTQNILLATLTASFNERKHKVVAVPPMISQSCASTAPDVFLKPSTGA